MKDDPFSDLPAFRVGAVRVEPQRHRLVPDDGEDVPLEPKVMHVLCVLAGRSGEVFTREQILEAVWEGSFGGDESLTRAISVLRKHLGAEAIETIPKRGYRLGTPVTPVTADDAAVGLPKQVPHSGQGPGEAPVAAAMAQKGELPGATRGWARHWRLALIMLVATVGIGVLLLPRLGALSPGNSHAPARPHAAELRIAVAPFSTVQRAVQNVQQDAGDSGDAALLAEGLGMAISEALSPSRTMAVIGQTSSWAFRGRSVPPVEAARLLGAQWLITGDFAPAEAGVRLDLSLVNAATGSAAWTGSVAAEDGDWRELELAAYRKLREGVQSVGLPEPAVFEIPTESDAAYRAYVAGRVLMARRTPADLRAAVARFEEAFALDPGFGIAYAFHTQVALQLPHETPAVAQSALTKAHQLAPNAPATHLA